MNWLIAEHNVSFKNLQKIQIFLVDKSYSIYLLAHTMRIKHVLLQNLFLTVSHIFIMIFVLRIAIHIHCTLQQKIAIHINYLFKFISDLLNGHFRCSVPDNDLYSLYTLWCIYTYVQIKL